MIRLLLVLALAAAGLARAEAPLKRGRNWAETLRLSFPERYVTLENYRVSGPFVPEEGTAFATAFGPELGGLDLKASYGPVSWRDMSRAWADPTQQHDLLIFGRKENAAAYVYAEFESPRAEDLLLLGGSDDTFTLWINGEKLASHEVFRASGPDQEKVAFRSRAGRNQLLLKVCQGTQGWNFYLDLRRPFQQAPQARLEELRALRAAHPEDERNSWAAALELAAAAQKSDPAAADALIAPFIEGHPSQVWPGPSQPLIKKGDSLVVVGDSITQQRMYTRLMELYLRACHPGMISDFRQSGWDGQRTEDLLGRLDQDVLAFKPTLVLDCYGANDTRWDKYGPAAVKNYRDSTRKLAGRLGKAGVRLVISGTSCAVDAPWWSEDKLSGPQSTNRILGDLRLHQIQEAQKLGLPFIDTFPAMLHAAYEGIRRHGGGFRLSGDDGVHPEWSGHLVLAVSRLIGLGVGGDLGNFVVDMKEGKARAEGEGHEILASGKGWARIRSSRYPFCVGPGPDSDHHTWASGARLAPLHDRLNRFTLEVRGAGQGNYRVRWGAEKKTFKGPDLARGINLAEHFEASNPFSAAFSALDQAVAKKQDHETWMLHKVLHGPLKGREWEAAVERAESERMELSRLAELALKPLDHEIKVEFLP